MCGGNTCPFLAKLVTFNRCVVAINGLTMTRNEPTIVCGGNTCPFLAKLVTYNRCVVAINGHLMIRNGSTIGVWWKYMSISGQISHLQ